MSLAWDDLRIFLAIARSGSLAGAARSLGVNHSTVFRRLNAFEDGLGVRLFERMTSGYVLTVAGEEMYTSAERIEQEIERLDRRVTGRDLSLSGTIVMTTTDTTAQYLVMPHLAKFRAAYPGIDVTVILDNQYVNLSKRQADVALRPTRNPPDTLVGRRIAEIAFAPFATEAYLQKHPDGLDNIEWVVPDETLAHLAASKWLKATYPNAKTSLSANSLLGVLLAAKEGMGAAMLPCFMGDQDPAFVRIADPIPGAGSTLWLLTHEDLRHTARVRAFMDFMADALIGDVDLLEGRAG